MRALALLGVFIVAKLVVLAGRSVELSGWTPIAYFWQDVLIAVMFLLLDRVIRRAWIGWTIYGSAVVYITINVPIARLLSSPLTWAMINAAGSALSDSIRRHVTVINATLMASIIACGIALPILFRKVKLTIPNAAILPALLIVALGPLATSRVETNGLGRNAIMALATTALPRITAQASDAVDQDWRVSPVLPLSTAKVDGDLTRLRGLAAGRNVVLILLESAGAQYLKPYGANRDPMPNLSTLARHAILFEHAYAVYPESIKEFFSVLCSRYPAMDTPAESYADVAVPTLASELKRAGYRTALFHSGRFMYLGMYAVVANRGYDILEDAGAIGGNYESSFGVDEPSTVHRSLEWIDSLRPGERFFLTYLPIAGHHPYDSPEAGPFPEQKDSDRYLNALHYADQAMGSLLDGLRARGLDQNTLFVIFGDHGQAFGQHDGNYGHSLFLYEENLRVPYLIAAPGLIAGQFRIDKPISVIDTTPTILDLLGADSPVGFQGGSALPPKARMALFYTDYSLGLMGLRDGCWKYIYELDSERSKLFDLCKNANETDDVSASNLERVAAYRSRLLRWSSAQKALVIKQTRGSQSK